MIGVNSHRRRLSSSRLTTVVAAGGVAPQRLAGWQELTDAGYNTAYRIRLITGDGLVLKVAPDAAMPGLTYEHDLMRTETLFYRTASGAIPVPEVVHADFSRQLVDSDFLLMTELPGTSWYDVREKLTADEQRRLRTQLGGVVAALHDVTGDEFGYPQLGTDPSWRVAFLSMLDAVLADAVRWATPLPLPTDEIRQLVEDNAVLLDDVDVPVLTHFDLWAGNILVVDATISGIVDGERAFWGDPLAEMASLALFGRIQDDEAFLHGYGGIEFDDSARWRLALYRAYLYLIMLVEGAPRGYGGPERAAMVALITRHLRTALEELRS